MLLQYPLSQRDAYNLLSHPLTIPTTQHIQRQAIDNGFPRNSWLPLHPLLLFDRLLCSLVITRDRHILQTHILYHNLQVAVQVRVTFRKSRWHLKLQTSMVSPQELLPALPLVSLLDLLLVLHTIPIVDLDLPFRTVTFLHLSMCKALLSMMHCSISACVLHI
jgi:hypothetical protein